MHIWQTSQALWLFTEKMSFYLTEIKNQISSMLYCWKWWYGIGIQAYTSPSILWEMKHERNKLFIVKSMPILVMGEFSYLSQHFVDSYEVRGSDAITFNFVTRWIWIPGVTGNLFVVTQRNQCWWDFFPVLPEMPV